MRKTMLLPPAGVFLLIGSLAAQQPAMQPVASVKQLHEAMISPSSDAIFDVGRGPENDAGWTALRNNAIILPKPATCSCWRAAPKTRARG